MEMFRKSILICVIIFCTTVYGIVNIDPEKKEKIDNFVNTLLFDCDRHSNVVGMNLAIVYIVHNWVWGKKFRQVVCFPIFSIDNLNIS